jgi:hypothetical protein
MLCGAISDFANVRYGNYRTSEMEEAELSEFVSGVDLAEDDFKMGSDAQRFLKRVDWGSGGNNFIVCTSGCAGVMPPSTKVGDKAFAIVGYQQPLFLSVVSFLIRVRTLLKHYLGGPSFLLRNCSDGNSQYSVVGECYGGFRSR